MAWTGGGTITLTVPCTILDTDDQSAIRIETDSPHRAQAAIYIDPATSPVPQVGQRIDWSRHHAQVEGEARLITKLALAFDPYPEFTNGAEQV